MSPQATPLAEVFNPNTAPNAERSPGHAWAFCCLHGCQLDPGASCSEGYKSEINPTLLANRRTTLSWSRHRSLARVQITHCDDEHLLRLNSQEASLLVDACVLVVLAAETVPQGALNPELASLLATLFEHLSPAMH